MSWPTKVGSASREGLSQAGGSGRRKLAAGDVGRVRPRRELWRSVRHSSSEVLASRLAP